MKMVKQPNGMWTLKDVILWTEGTFRGFGSPKEGDKYTGKDLQQMVRSHYEAQLEPRFYYGHPLNPTLAMLAKPKGEIVDMRVAGNTVLGDIADVPYETAREAVNDNVRLSPDMRMNYLDPATGKSHKWVITGLAMLGAKAPGNKLIPALGDQLQLDPGKFYASSEGQSLSRAYAAEGMRSFTLDFSGRFPAADPSLIAARQRLGMNGSTRSFAADEQRYSYRNRLEDQFFDELNKYL
jgi:hypothetical protein